MASKFSKRRRLRPADYLSDAFGELPREIARRHLPPATPQLDADWNLWLSNADADAYQRLAVHYAPLAKGVVMSLRAKHSHLMLDPVEDLIGDGLLGLLKVLHYAKFGGWPFIRFAARAITSEIFLKWGARREPKWTKAGRERAGQLSRIRSEFTIAHGRVPTADEVNSQLAALIDNPRIQIGDLPCVQSLSTDADARSAVRDVADDHCEAPDARLSRRELMKLAERGLDKEDRKLLGWILDGANPTEIGKQLGVTRKTARHRANGLLWTLRQRADLAAALGVKPIASPFELRCGPARLAAGIVNPSPAPLPVLSRERRSDEGLIDLLKAGHSYNRIILATVGGVVAVRRRLHTLAKRIARENLAPHNSPLKAVS